MQLASLAQLERCHRRHDEVMTRLLDAARRFAAGRPEAGDLDAVHEAVAYFGRAVTRHFVDEEGSVFPRLSTRRPELAAALAELSAEHPAQIAMQAEVTAAARDLDGEARPAAGKTLLDAATRLAEAHRSHVGREDEIFAAAHEALTTEDDAEIVAEMEMRRDREEGGGGHRRRGGGGGGGGRGGGRGRMAQEATEPRTQPASAHSATAPAAKKARPAGHTAPAKGATARAVGRPAPAGRTAARGAAPTQRTGRLVSGTAAAKQATARPASRTTSAKRATARPARRPPGRGKR